MGLQAKIASFKCSKFFHFDLFDYKWITGGFSRWPFELIWTEKLNAPSNKQLEIAQITLTANQNLD